MSGILFDVKVVCVSLIVISLMLVGQSYAGIDPKTIVGAWRFNEGKGDVVKDASENGSDGKIDGAKWVDGKFGSKALRFDGKDDSVECGNDKSFDITDTITLAAWHKADVYNPDSFLIIKRNPDCSAGSYALGPGPTSGPAKTRFRLRIKGGWRFAEVPSELSTGRWYHLAGTYNGKTLRIFLDGEEVGSTEFVGDIESNPATGVYLGRECCGKQTYFDGIIDEPMIFNVALTEGDIKEIVRKGLSVSPSGKLATAWGEVKTWY